MMQSLQRHLSIFESLVLLCARGLVFGHRIGLGGCVASHNTFVFDDDEAPRISDLLSDIKCLQAYWQLPFYTRQNISDLAAPGKFES